MSTTPEPDSGAAPETLDPAPPAVPAVETEEESPSGWRETFRSVTQANWVVLVGALILAILAGSIMIAFTDERVQETAGYLFARPQDFFAALWTSVRDAYAALFRGSIWNYNSTTFAAGIRPLTATLTNATPLIAAGLGVALAFRAGLFNIGGQGQMLVSAATAGAIGIFVSAPFPIHLMLAMGAGLLAGALWAGIAGALRAYTGAHEVITTIMLNWIAFYGVSYLLSTPGLLQAAGSFNPKSAPTSPSAQMPKLVGDGFNLHWGFVFSLIAVAVVWWILNRSKIGFEYRAVGANPHAATTAGIDVKRTTTSVMLVAGALVGLAGASQVLGTVTNGFSYDIDAGIGFDAITVALLGGSQPIGVLFAGILFGAFKAGGSVMQANQGIPIEIVAVIQSLIVLFIAAPPLVRHIFRLPQPGAPQRTRRNRKEVAA